MIDGWTGWCEVCLAALMILWFCAKICLSEILAELSHCTQLTVREPPQLQTVVRRCGVWLKMWWYRHTVLFSLYSTPNLTFFLISTPLSLHQTSQGNFCLRPLSANVFFPEVCQHWKLILPVCYLLYHDNWYCHYTVVGLIILLTEMQCFKLRLFYCFRKVFCKN